MFRYVPFAGASLILASTLAAQCESQKTQVAAWFKPEKTIVETAVAAGQFDTLVAAVKAAGLVDALSSEGPFTVFAPTDAAFAKIPKQTLASLLQPENRDQLTRILKFHVVSGKFDAKHVVGMKSLKTLAAPSAAVMVSDEGASIAGVRIVKTDIECSNGIIHVVDSVMMPPSAANIVGTAKAAGNFNTLLAAAKAAGLVDVLSGEGPFTVFAPTDAAFAKLPKGTVASLLEPKNKAKLQAILKNHVLSGNVDARTAVAAGMAKTLQGGKVKIGIDNGRLTVDGAKIIATDIDAGNGTIHVIDSVILPN